jgi:NAD(P)H-hydrate repair Nnr-like enzyme with NAD(P)H-hydrate epimerase domain
MSRPLPPSDSLPYALYTAAQVRALDQAAIASGMPGGALMARAGEAAYQLAPGQVARGTTDHPALRGGQ